jgi:hypothetical protein
MCTFMKGLLPLHARICGADVTAGLECSGPTGGSAGHGCQVHSAQPAWCMQAVISRVCGCTRFVEAQCLGNCLWQHDVVGPAKNVRSPA